MDQFWCPGVACDRAVASRPERDESIGRWVGQTCWTCEQRWLDDLSDTELVRLARDPFLSIAALRQLSQHPSMTVRDALVSRGVDHLPPSLIVELDVLSTTSTSPSRPYAHRYRHLGNAGDAGLDLTLPIAAAAAGN